MLSNLLKEHSQRSSQRRALQERRRQEACQAAAQLTSALTDHLNVGVAQAYLNQKRLDAEAKQLHTHANNFVQQTSAWLQLADQFNHTLKELGDIESWAKSIEGDMKVVSTALEYTHKVNREAAAAPGPSTS
eukprot:snap_masked-scaffold632_size121914-processed-gene-0.11 protein:Tk02606 transcript:snap_masked-scaffold632_size121914-processed-gene-0.11-mRNA-1 annotation:"conserved hypothetical protein"